MTNHYRTKRINCHEIRDAPFPREHITCPYNHHGGTQDAKHEGEFEAFEETGDFFEKRCVFDFLCCGAPRHVDFEEMAEESLGDVEGDAAEEDGQKEEPFEVFPDCWGC